jgi:hypothetical protein
MRSHAFCWLRVARRAGKKTPVERTKSGGSETPEKAGTHTIPLTYDPWTEYEFVGCRVRVIVSRLSASTLSGPYF